MITTVAQSCEHTKIVGKSVGLSPNKRFSLMPFLSRHDDFNDAYVEDKD